MKQLKETKSINVFENILENTNKQMIIFENNWKNATKNMRPFEKRMQNLDFSNWIVSISIIVDVSSTNSFIRTAIHTINCDLTRDCCVPFLELNSNPYDDL